MNWTLRFLPEAQEDLNALAGNQRLLVSKAIKKICQNPLPMSEGGYGKPLGNKSTSDLAGFLKVKLRGAGLRVVYKVIRTETEIVIVVIGAREDDEVYRIAGKRISKYNL